MKSQCISKNARDSNSPLTPRHATVFFAETVVLGKDFYLQTTSIAITCALQKSRLNNINKIQDHGSIGFDPLIIMVSFIRANCSCI